MDQHPNISVLQRFNPADLSGLEDIFAEDVVWRFFNPLLPEIEGDYHGHDGLRTFFDKIADVTGGTFKITPVSTTAIGDELVVSHTINTLMLPGRDVVTDVVEVWRIVDGRITEVWDIPSVHAQQTE